MFSLAESQEEGTKTPNFAPQHAVDADRAYRLPYASSIAIKRRSEQAHGAYPNSHPSIKPILTPTAQLVELKNGETFNGHLVNCDNFMNITLKEVYQTNPDGDRFWKLKECYIRGSTIKYIRIPENLLDVVKDEQNRAREAGRSNSRGGHVGGRGGRGAPVRGTVIPLCDILPLLTRLSLGRGRGAPMRGGRGRGRGM
ncbi:related to U6 snRNA-associated Sm-like protein LSm4 [Armillaria ostoyae]|uniref:LSM complex subunit LSM4 n=1 Tax=Armillaria ostoyae TaxID=47428 RepID=A0A284RFS5_ARMOS|nr:related to U6 snRNA-associated Sm-like protein LSm4 [Armillaria ostoyae]